MKIKTFNDYNDCRSQNYHFRIIMTESYSPDEVLFKYYLNGAEVPTNFNLMPHKLNKKMYSTPEQYDNVIRRWITEMPENATYNAVVNMINLLYFSSI